MKIVGQETPQKRNGLMSYKQNYKKDNTYMSVESIASIGIVKWVMAALVIPAYLFLFRRQEKIKEDTYTKLETKEQINLRITPVIERLAHHSEVVKENTRSMNNLSKTFNTLSERLVRVEVITEEHK